MSPHTWRRVAAPRDSTPTFPPAFAARFSAATFPKIRSGCVYLYKMAGQEACLVSASESDCLDAPLGPARPKDPRATRNESARAPSLSSASAGRSGVFVHRPGEMHTGKIGRLDLFYSSGRASAIRNFPIRSAIFWLEQNPRGPRRNRVGVLFRGIWVFGRIWARFREVSALGVFLYPSQSLIGAYPKPVTGTCNRFVP